MKDNFKQCTKCSKYNIDIKSKDTICDQCNTKIDLLPSIDELCFDNFKMCIGCSKLCILKLSRNIYCNDCRPFYTEIYCLKCTKYGSALKSETQLYNVCDTCRIKNKTCGHCLKNTCIDGDLCELCKIHYKKCQRCSKWKYHRDQDDPVCNICIDYYTKCQECNRYMLQTCKWCTDTKQQIIDLNKLKPSFRMSDGSPLGDYIEQYLYADAEKKVHVRMVSYEYMEYLSYIGNKFSGYFVPQLKSRYPDIIIQEEHILNCGMRSKIFEE